MGAGSHTVPIRVLVDIVGLTKFRQQQRKQHVSATDYQWTDVVEGGEVVYESARREVAEKQEEAK